MNLRTPVRYVRRIANVVRGRDIWQRAQIRERGILLGNANAGWQVSPGALTPSSVVYSLGVGQDISFDLEMIRRFGVRVHAFDPTPRSIAWLQTQSLPPEFVFHSYGLADRDGVCSFVPPANPAHVSHSLIVRHTGLPPIELPVRRLSTVMSLLGHSEIDVLKMDIEGAEYGVLNDLVQCGISVRQLLVEFHHRWPEIGLQKTRDAVRALNTAGYRIFHVSARGEEYSFLRREV